MHFLLIGALLAAGPPTNAQAVPTASVVVSPSTTFHGTGPVVAKRIMLRALAPAVVTSSFGSDVVDLVPYGNDLNRLYRQYRSERRWQGGVALVFETRDWQQRLTLNLWFIRIPLTLHRARR